uniref:Uncharacterized protein n=1 Tax=Cannabis sativa TaxID=3483 RepID=A0A803P9Z9_CANSA
MHTYKFLGVGGGVDQFHDPGLPGTPGVSHVPGTPGPPDPQIPKTCVFLHSGIPGPHDPQTPALRVFLHSRHPRSPRPLGTLGTPCVSRTLASLGPPDPCRSPALRVFLHSASPGPPTSQIPGTLCVSALRHPRSPAFRALPALLQASAFLAFPA